MITLTGCENLILKNKGAVGQVLERIIGISNSSRLRDFEDGELKTNKARWGGEPAETMGIMVINQQIDRLLEPHPFESSRLFKKIRNVLFVPVYYARDIPRDEWIFLPPIHCDLASDEFQSVCNILRSDYDHILAELRRRIKSGHNLDRQIDGRYIQIRNKDSKDSWGEYHPIYSRVAGRYISDRNFGFYYKKDFMRRLQRESSRYPYYG